MTPGDGRVARHALVSGQVQGVGFRWRARELARALGLAGWVRNLHDGRVELLVEGDRLRVESFFGRLAGSAGPGHVTGVEGRDEEPSGLRDFDVRESSATAASPPSTPDPGARTSSDP